MIKRLLKNRFFYLALAVLVLMGIIGIKLYSLQIVNGSSYDKMVTTRNQATVLLDARRGNIYDKNGVLLAGSEVTYKLQMTYVDKPQAERDNMYLRLINLLESNGDTCVNKLAQYIGPDLEWGRSLAGDENSVKRSAWISTIVKRRADKERIETAMDAFRYLRNELFEIADSYNNADAYKIMTIRYATRTEGLNTMTPMTLSESISEKSMIAIENGFLAFPGVYTDVSYKRVYYHTDVTSHIVGYVRKIDAEEYAAHSGEGYSMEDIIGKVGIEASCESILRGTKGKRELFYDRDTGRVRTVSYTEPKSGSDVYLTIDVQLQRIAYNALIDNIEQIKETADPTDGNYGDANAGSVVMEDARTGKIIAMASYPSYDSNIFVAPSGDAEAQEAIIALYADENSPSLNRATQGIYPIGSTFKPIDAVAALEVGLPGGRWHYEKCTGLMVLDDMNHRCLAVHGSLGMDMAFTVSCNMYFQQIALLDGVGIENLDRYAKMFGLGEKTGIEINEYAGYRSNRETMELKETDKSHVWSDSDTAQTAIGQLYTQITPLQLCNYAAALGNGGYRNQPTIILKTVGPDGTETYNETNSRVKLDISDETLNIVKEGMKSVVNTENTSANRALGYLGENFVAAKTGTPQTGLEAFEISSHSAVICYAPANDPEVAISVFIEHGAWGRFAFPTASKMLSTYYGVEEPTPAPDATADPEQAHGENGV